jgi:bacterioferritin
LPAGGETTGTRSQLSLFWSGLAGQRPGYAAQPEEDAVDQNDFVDALNDDLSSEFRSIVQYVQHIATLKGAKYLSTIAELEAHVVQELRHALVLAQQVEFLGGVPTTMVPEVPSSSDSREALCLDLELELSQLQR